MLCPQSWERYHKTAHSAELVSEKVTITNPIHPLHGQSVVVRSIRRLDKSVFLIIEHPDGGVLSIRADETSLALTPPVIVVEGKLPLFEPKKLLQLRHRVDKLSHPKIANSQETEKVGNQKIDDETKQNQGNPPPRIRRTHSTLDRADSEVGGKNARSTNTNKSQ